MRTTLAIAFTVLAVLAGPRVASATVGGPTLIEVLGYDTRDARVYYVMEAHDESGQPPRVFFMRTAGHRAGVAVEVRSIQQGLSDDRHDHFQARLARLRKRLVPLRPLPGRRQQYDSVIADRRSRRVARALNMERSSAGTMTTRDVDNRRARCRVARLSFARDGLAGTIKLAECRGRAGVVAAYPIPKTRAIFVVASSRPDRVESSYASESALLMVPPQSVRVRGEI